MNFIREALSISGRFNRKKYIASMFISYAILVLSILLAGLAEYIAKPLAYTILFVLGSFSIIYNITSTIKRFHDLGCATTAAILFILLGIFAGTFIWLSIISALLGFYLLFKKGEEGPNKYGEDPLAKTE